MSKEFSEKRILFVDDDQFFLDIYSMKFKNVGIEIDTATGGEQALNKLKQNKPYDLIILDIIMPNIDGIAVVETMKKENLAPDTKILMLTNQDNPKDVEKLKSLGVENYIIKATMIPSEVVSKVLEILGKDK